MTRRDALNARAGREISSHDPTLAPPHVRRAGRIMLWVGVAFPLVVYAVAVAVAPLNVLDRHPGVRRATDALRQWLLSVSPSIDLYGHARSTDFPQVAMLGAALGTCAFLVMVVSILVQTTLFFGPLRNAHSNRPRKPALNQFAELIALPLCGLLCMWIFYCLKGDPSFAAGLSTQSKAGYIFMSSMSIALAGAGVGGWLIQARLFLFDVFSREYS
jgi:hypothetical protein